MNKNKIAKILQETLSKNRNVTKVVQFNKSNPNDAFEVQFSERGFEIDGNDLSFEDLEKAISKGYNITLEKGGGRVLDQVKMQQILKYKPKNPHEKDNMSGEI